MRLRSTEDGHGAVDLFRVAVEVGIMLRAVVVETKHPAHIVQRDVMLRAGIHREGVFGHIIFQVRAEHPLNTPHPRIIVSVIERRFAHIGLMEIKLFALSIA